MALNRIGRARNQAAIRLAKCGENSYLRNRKDQKWKEDEAYEGGR